MLVQTELMRSSRPERVMVRAHTPFGRAVVVWRGDPREAAGRHVIEWTVDEDVRWGLKTQPAPLAEPGVREEGGHVVLRGRLELGEDSVAVLTMGGSQLLFQVRAPPPPGGIDGTWVEVTLAADKVELYPYAL
ncbi:hypothetical protein ACFCX4_06235 [Kitasatospora sp. NPDC056327]|uniref:hypothetical protein n=1 Tax=Kitasatospora sp. NPDC056327 TaxID=3345785 RepID=UPI0035D8DE2A